MKKRVLEEFFICDYEKRGYCICGNARQKLEIELIPILEKTYTALSKIVNWIEGHFGQQNIENNTTLTEEDKNRIRANRTARKKISAALDKAPWLRSIPSMQAAEVGSFLFERWSENKIVENAQKMLSSRGNKTVKVENTFNNTINTTQPADVAVLGVIEDDIRGTQYQEQLAGM